MFKILWAYFFEIFSDAFECYRLTSAVDSSSSAQFCSLFMHYDNTVKTPEPIEAYVDWLECGL